MASIGQRYWSPFWRITKPYLTSESRRQAYTMLVILIGLLLVLSGLNVVISFVGRDFMTAIAGRQSHRIFVFAALYLAVFAASTVAGGFQRYVQLRLGLHWREWLSRHFFHRYLVGHAYHRINAQKEVDNPDERIANDILIFTTMTLSFLVMATSSVITLVSFIGVLWTISIWLVLAAFAYPAIGTALIVWTGRRLIRLNHLQLKKEADFRFALVHVRAEAEAIALEQAEQQEEPRLEHRLRAVVKNKEIIITILRNLMFVRGGYNYLDQLIPVLIVAPLFVAGQVEFGVITQASMAFSQIFNAFSLIAEQYQNLAEYAAVVGRVSSLDESITASAEPSGRPLHVIEADAPFAFQDVTLQEPKGNRMLVRNLSLEVPRGRRVLITGPNGAGLKAIFRATAGLWDNGHGKIHHPAGQRTLFLPERPYLHSGTLRSLFHPAGAPGHVTDERMWEVLRAVGLETFVRQLGGLDIKYNWATVLSLGEQQLLAFARLLLVKPDFAFLDHATSALSEHQQLALSKLLAPTAITYVSVGEGPPGLREHYDAHLELQADGTLVAGPTGKPA